MARRRYLTGTQVMSGTNTPAEEADSTNPFETSEAMLPTEGGGEAKNATSVAEPPTTNSTDTAEAARSPETSEAKPEPATAQTPDPWAESPPAPEPESSKTPIVMLGIILITAGVTVFFCIQNSRLQTQLGQLDTQLIQSQAKQDKLQAQVDSLSKPVGVKTVGLKIISAVYGSGQNFNDVTDRVCDLLARPDSEFFARPEWLKADPAPGFNKELIVTYEFHNQRHIFMTGEGGRVTATILLDAAK